MADQFRSPPAWPGCVPRRQLYAGPVWHLALRAIGQGQRMPVDCPNWISGVLDLLLRTTDRLERDGQESPAIILLSSVSLTQQEITDFLRDQGALIAGSQKQYIGRLTANGYLWVQFATDQLYEYDPDAFLESERVRMTGAAGTHHPPAQWPARSHAWHYGNQKALAEGERAAADLVLAFAQRWPCVI